MKNYADAIQIHGKITSQTKAVLEELPNSQYWINLIQNAWLQSPWPKEKTPNKIEIRDHIYLLRTRTAEKLPNGEIIWNTTDKNDIPSGHEPKIWAEFYDGQLVRMGVMGCGYVVDWLSISS